MKEPKVIWQKDIWITDRWAYGRVVWVPTSLRAEQVIRFEVATERDAMNIPVWRDSEPFRAFIEELAGLIVKPMIVESVSLPPKKYGEKPS